MKIRIKVFLILYMFSFCMLLTGCERKDETNIVNQKINAEIKYLDNSITDIVQKYFIGKYSESESIINWDNISKDYQNIENSISVIIIDLASIQSDKNDIIEIEKYTTDCSSAISKQDINTFLIRMCDLYSMLPRYISGSEQDKEFAQLQRVKSSLMYSEYYISINQFDDANLNISKAEEQYNELLKRQEYIENYSYRANRIYLGIQEIKLLIQKENSNESIQKYIEISELL